MFVAGTAVLILLIGVSRIYLGVHFLTDVLAGFAAGICTFLVLKIAVAKIQQVFDKNRTV
ncbi:phosphatase PAP2 family protein [Metabacillus fastidiosus]|uniref:phosphatase PAP2 family protein n=1 Tax=Metabacillus fastidiosus TaxID=1458 RepID=UPI003D2A970A